MEAAPRTGRDLIHRALGPGDAAAVQRAVVACPPLTLHTPYTYWVMLGAQQGLCMGACSAGEVQAFVLGIQLGPERLLVWQIGVRPEHRGVNLGVALLGDVWGVAQRRGVAGIEATISADNRSSRATFERFATAHALTMTRIGDAVCTDAQGVVAETEDWYRLTPG